MPSNDPDAPRWTLSFDQDKGGYREIRVVDGPCLVGNSQIEVIAVDALLTDEAERAAEAYLLTAYGDKGPTTIETRAAWAATRVRIAGALRAAFSAALPGERA